MSDSRSSGGIMPSSNINLINNVRNEFMLDASGSVSLNSTKYRDGARKGVGNVSVMDFAGRAWSQGREIRKTQDGDSTGSIRPYCWDQRHDNINHSEVEYTLLTENGLPVWKHRHNGKRFVPTASYANSYFQFVPGDTLDIRRLHFSCNIEKLEAYLAYCEVAVIGYTNGYLSGGTRYYVNWSRVEGDRTWAFDVRPQEPFVVVSFKFFASDYGSQSPNYVSYQVKNCEIKKA